MRPRPIAFCLLLSLSVACPAANDTVSLSLHDTRLTATFAGGKARVLDVDALSAAGDDEATRAVAFASPQRSRDARLVGALVLSPNCCTSYPIALEVVAFDAGGRIRRIDGDGLAIFGWCFSRDGKAVALRTSTVHGSAVSRYLLRRIEDGRTLSRWVESDDAQGSASQASMPDWAHCAA